MSYSSKKLLFFPEEGPAALSDPFGSPIFQSTLTFVAPIVGYRTCKSLYSLCSVNARGVAPFPSFTSTVLKCSLLIVGPYGRLVPEFGKAYIVVLSSTLRLLLRFLRQYFRPVYQRVSTPLALPVPLPKPQEVCIEVDSVISVLL